MLEPVSMRLLAIQSSSLYLASSET